MNNKLIAYRKMLNMTQTDIASEIGIALTSYSHKETGKREFTQNEMVQITKIIQEKIPDVTMDDIFFNNKVSKLKTLSS